MAKFVLGTDAKMYYGAPEDALGALTEFDFVKDITVNLERGETDVTTRENAGWRGTGSTLRECTVDFEMVWPSPTDTSTGFAARQAQFDAIRDTYLNAAGDYSDGEIELAILDGAKATSGVQGPKGRFVITSFNRSEPLEEALSVSVSAKLSVFGEWVDV